MKTLKNKAKKGFTIVELVIVIAVIAILAAVLIPTFTNVVENANETAAMEECRNEWVSYLSDIAGEDTTYVNKTYYVTYTKDSAIVYYFKVEKGQFDTTVIKNESTTTITLETSAIDLTSGKDWSNSKAAIYISSDVKIGS